MSPPVPAGATPELALPPLKRILSPNYSSRHGTPINLICVHDCEGSYAGSINWFCQPVSQVSAHYVLREDGGEATMMVDPANKAWHACAFNARSIGVEMAGFAAKGYAASEWDAAAAIVAFLLHRYAIPCRWVRGGQGAGFCSHYDLGKAGGGHHDPTTDSATWSAFCARVEAAYALEAPASWLVGGGGLPGPAPAGWTPSGDPRHDLAVGSLSWVQTRLNALHYAIPLLVVDGIMGDRTEIAVKAFQRAAGLVVDGDPGPKTIAALEAAH
jgi:N-acetyl-anhydromuramyl-L-alanine amidase AmpD